MGGPRFRAAPCLQLTGTRGYPAELPEGGLGSLWPRCQQNAPQLPQRGPRKPRAAASWVCPPRKTSWSSEASPTPWPEPTRVAAPEPLRASPRAVLGAAGVPAPPRAPGAGRRPRSLRCSPQSGRPGPRDSSASATRVPSVQQNAPRDPARGRVLLTSRGLTCSYKVSGSLPQTPYLF